MPMRVHLVLTPVPDTMCARASISDWWSGIVKLRPLWLLMATCVVYALYFYIAEVATHNVADAPTRDAINTYRSVGAGN